MENESFASNLLKEIEAIVCERWKRLEYKCGQIHITHQAEKRVDPATHIDMNGTIYEGMT